MKLKERLRVGNYTSDENTQFLEITTDEGPYLPNVIVSLITISDGVETTVKIGPVRTESLVNVARVLSLMKKIVSE